MNLTVISTLSSQDLVLPPSLESLPINELAHIQRVMEVWTVSLNWLIKKEWDEKHEIPDSDQPQSILKTRGMVLHRVRELCIECDTFQGALPGRCIAYSDASVWFKSVFYDLVAHSFMTDKLGSQESILGSDRLFLNRLKKLENPCDQKLKHLHLFLESSICLAKKSLPVHRDYWKPFCDALNAYSKAPASSNGTETCAKPRKTTVTAL